MKLKIDRKQIKERAKKIANWIQIECEIKDVANLTSPKEYELKTVQDILTIMEVEKIISKITSEPGTDKKNTQEKKEK